MAVARMKRLEMAGLLEDRESWLSALQDAEVLEIEPAEAEQLGGEFQAKKDIEEECSAIEREMGSIDRTLSFISRFHPVRPNFIQQFAGVKMYLKPNEFAALIEHRELAEDWVEQGAVLSAELNELERRRAQLIADARTLRPWLPLELSEEELLGTGKVRIIAGSLEQRRLEGLTAAMNEVAPAAKLCPVGSDERFAYILIFVKRSAAAELSGMLAANELNTVTLPSFGSSVSSRLESIEAELKDLDSEEAALMNRVDELARKRPQLQAVYDYLQNERHKLQSASVFSVGQRSFYFRGWIRDTDIPGLEKAVENVNRPHYLAVRDPEEGEEPPSAFMNKALVTPFEALVQGFALPRYGDIDPTAVMAPFFFVFFGFALGDAGYGLLLALINIGLLKFLPMGHTGKKLAVMFSLGSISSIVIGLGTGGFFGNILKFPPLFGLDPVANPTTLLLVALALGLVQMFFGLFMSGFLSARQSGVVAALAKEGAWMVFLASALAFLAKDYVGLKDLGTPLMYALIGSAFLVVLGATHGRKGFQKILGIPSGLFTLYNSIGFFSDVLSYSRVMALALSGAVVGNIVNDFATKAFSSPMFGIGYIFGIVIFAFGHALNMGLGVLGAYVHASRLQYLEFFGKFYEGGGRPFNPLRTSYKYTHIIQEREA